MYRVIRPLNNNGLLVRDGEGREVILLGRGAGFGRKSGERLSSLPEGKRYTLLSPGETSALQLVNTIRPAMVELAARVFDLAKETFPDLETEILLPMADHIAMALERREKGTTLKNPLQHDIMAMFPEEYEVAAAGLALIEKETGTRLPPEEAGFIALHLHAGRSGEKPGASLATLGLASRCVERIEAETGRPFPRGELKYTRLISHLCFMIIRIRRGERVNVDIAGYIQSAYPETYAIAERVGAYMGTELAAEVAPAELSLLALHIQRVL